MTKAGTFAEISTWYQKIWIKIAVGRKEGGTKLHRKAEAEYYLRRGNDYLDVGKFDQATSEYGKNLNIHPLIPETYHNLGLAYFMNLNSPAQIELKFT
jgi:tetratricopeptide (TPR) repeat protein